MAAPSNKTVVTMISKISTKLPPASSSALVVIHGLELGLKFDLGREKTIIGRSSKCHVQVDQDAVSRNHATIYLRNGNATIEDLESTNGTFVNDIAVEGKVTLRNGDLIKIGRTIFKYIAGGNVESQYHEEIYRLTTTDGLTQIFNRRYFLETLDREISRCHRYARELSLVMIDIDFFKRINDERGHLAGDHVLKQLAMLLNSKIRREDVLARYGGEEFALLLPEINLKGALVTAERMRKTVAAEKFVFEDEPVAMSISCGVATLCKDMLSKDLIGVADDKLYEAKEGGRNRVCG